MTITPSGSPAWTRQSDHTQYGGSVNKRNFMDQGVTNALTDVGAEDFVRICADLAALARVAPMWVLTFTCSDSSPAAPTITVANGMTGVRVVSYLGSGAPTGFPSAVRNGNGDVTFTFASSYTDDYSVAGAWVPVTAEASLHGTTAGAPTCVISGSTVRVRVFDAAGAAIINPTVTLEVG